MKYPIMRIGVEAIVGNDEDARNVGKLCSVVFACMFARIGIRVEFLSRESVRIYSFDEKAISDTVSAVAEMSQNIVTIGLLDVLVDSGALNIAFAHASSANLTDEHQDSGTFFDSSLMSGFARSD